MNKIHRILVPMDFSAKSCHALEGALNFASKVRTEVHLVHFYQLPLPVNDVGLLVEEDNLGWVDHYEKMLGEIKREALRKDPQLCIHAHLQAGSFGEGLKRSIVLHDIDLVVMGVQESNWLEKYVIGDQPSIALEEISTPLLFIPDSTTFQNLRKIVFSTDFQWGDLEVLLQVASLAKIYQAEIEVLHLSKASSDRIEDSLDWFREMAKDRISYPLVHFTNLEVDEVSPEVLHQVLSQQKPDLIVMSTREKNVLERILQGSFTKEMLFHNICPVLVFHVQDFKKQS